MIKIVIQIFLVLPVIVYAESYQYSCPERISTGLNYELTNSGWERFDSNTALEFDYMQLSSGHPNNEYFLRERFIESVEFKGKKTNKMIFDISDQPNASAFYLNCYYKDSDIAITKELNESAIYCEMLESRKAHISCWNEKKTTKEYP
jgi:hypothetical protein